MRISSLLFLVLPVVAFAISQPLTPVVVVGRSMEPTMAPGSVYVGTSDFSEISRGDVVLVRHGKEMIVKRVAFLPGDRVPQFYFGLEWVVAHKPWQLKFFKRKKFPLRETVVPVGHVYVLGDNPPDSTDSRHFGPVSVDRIERKVLNVTDITIPLLGAQLSRATHINLKEEAWARSAFYIPQPSRVTKKNPVASSAALGA